MHNDKTSRHKNVTTYRTIGVSTKDKVCNLLGAKYSKFVLSPNSSGNALVVIEINSDCDTNHKNLAIELKKMITEQHFDKFEVHNNLTLKWEAIPSVKVG